jgi:hypothetical protein
MCSETFITEVGVRGVEREGDVYYGENERKTFITKLGERERDVYYWCSGFIEATVRHRHSLAPD